MTTIRELEDGLLNTKEQCKLLSCSRATLERRRSTGQIPLGRLINGRRFVPRAEFLRAVQAMYDGVRPADAPFTNPPRNTKRPDRSPDAPNATRKERKTKVPK